MAQVIPHLYMLPYFIAIFVFTTFIMSANSLATVYATDIINNNNSNMKDYHEVAKFDHFNEPFDQRVFGKLNIDVKEVTPSSIHVMWRLSNLSHSDSAVESTFLCETLNGRIVSDKLLSDSDSFRFEFLNSNTKYVICVHLLEKSPSRNTSILHYNCQTFSTIPVIRGDSILGLGLTMSYFVGVVLLGYLTWYRRARIKKKKEEAEKLKEEENETEKQDDYRQFLQATGTGGFSNYATNEYDRQMESNGGAVHKANSFRDCSGACVPFNVKEEEELVEYNASKREISF